MGSDSTLSSTLIISSISILGSNLTCFSVVYVDAGVGPPRRVGDSCPETVARVAPWLLREAQAKPSKLLHLSMRN